MNDDTLLMNDLACSYSIMMDMMDKLQNVIYLSMMASNVVLQ